MSSNVKEQRLIAGLRANAAAFLITISFFMGFGIIFPIIALILEKENRFVRSYSKQTLSLSVLILVGALLNIVIFIGSVIYVFLIGILAIIQVIAAINAILGKEFEIPYLGKIMNLLFVEE